MGERRPADTLSVRAIAGPVLFLGVVFVAILTLGLFFGMMAAALLALAMSARGRSF
jgi:uncharacterized membrane protein YvlD (DUF360 family)